MCFLAEFCLIGFRIRSIIFIFCQLFHYYYYYYLFIYLFIYCVCALRRRNPGGLGHSGFHASDGDDRMGIKIKNKKISRASEKTPKTPWTSHKTTNCTSFAELLNRDTQALALPRVLPRIFTCFEYPPKSLLFK